MTLGKYTVHFRHYRKHGKMRTHARLHLGECMKEMGGGPCLSAHEMQGETRCSGKDKFDGARGQREALAHAIASLPRGQRTEMWKDYLAQVKTEDPNVARARTILDSAIRKWSCNDLAYRQDDCIVEAFAAAFARMRPR